MQRRRRLDQTAAKNVHGFSFIELLIAVGVLMVLAAIFTPGMMNAVSNIKLRYSATDLSGLMQKARIEAARKNTFYSIEQTTLSPGEVAYYVDLNKNNTYSPGEALVEMGSQVTVFLGAGSGAPGEAAFITSLNFAVNPTAVLPKFNARGLPCVLVGQTCSQIPGQGFVYFLSRNTTVGTSWASVVVTPSGRVQVWSYSGNWVQL